MIDELTFEELEKNSIAKLFVPNPVWSYLLRARGDSMQEANISDGDILIVDRSLKAENGQIIIALLDNEFTVKRLVLRDGVYFLKPENPKYNEVCLEGREWQVWGVVTWTLHRNKIAKKS